MIFIDFSISLSSATQGNHAKHKLGARFAQGWRKCFHACGNYPNIQYNMIYLYHINALYYLRCLRVGIVCVFFSGCNGNWNLAKLQGTGNSPKS